MDDVLFSSSSDAWATPDALFKQISETFGPFDLDPCATRQNRKAEWWFGDRTNDGHQPIFNNDDFTDGLTRKWRNIMGQPANVFVNPPFCREKKMYVDPWVEKAINEVDERNARQVVMLVPARTDTKYWQDLIFPCADLIAFIRGRVKFGGGTNSAPFPSAIVVFQQVMHSIHREPQVITWGQER